MTRLQFFLSLLGAAQVPKVSGDRVACAHTWIKGPFYVAAAETYEEPDYYPPSALVHVEHCSACGIIRLPEDMWGLNGANISAGHVK